MHRSNTFSRRLLTLGASALASVTLLGGGVLAQEATPESTPGGPSEGYPVAVHQGTCEEHQPEAAYEIGNAVTYGTTGGTEPQTVGAEGGVTTVLLGVSGTIDNSIDTLGNEGHVIVVHASPEDDTVVACGQIAGAVNEGELALAITPAEGSTVVGVAILQDEDGSTNAKVYLFDTAVADTSATPAS